MVLEPHVDVVTRGSHADAAERLGDLIRATIGDVRRVGRLAERVLRELRTNEPDMEADWRLAA